MHLKIVVVLPILILLTWLVVFFLILNSSFSNLSNIVTELLLCYCLCCLGLYHLCICFERTLQRKERSLRKIPQWQYSGWWKVADLWLWGMKDVVYLWSWYSTLIGNFSTTIYQYAQILSFRHCDPVRRRTGSALVLQKLSQSIPVISSWRTDPVIWLGWHLLPFQFTWFGI